MTVAIAYIGGEPSVSVDVGPAGWPSTVRLESSYGHALIDEAVLPRFYEVAPEEDWIVSEVCDVCGGSGWDPARVGQGAFPCGPCGGSGLAGS